MTASKYDRILQQIYTTVQKLLVIRIVMRSFVGLYTFLSRLCKNEYKMEKMGYSSDNRKD